jgi:hypothetical protein
MRCRNPWSQVDPDLDEVTVALYLVINARLNDPIPGVNAMP